MTVELKPARPNAVERDEPELALSSERTLEALYDQFGSVAFSLAFSITASRELAEQVVMRSFVAAWNDQERGRASAAQFFATLMHSVRADAVARRVAKRGDGPIAGFATSTRADAVRSVEHAVAQALQELPDEQRSVLALAYFGGMAVGEIAAELQAPMNNVKESLRAAMRHLRSVLGQNSSGMVSA